MDVHIHPEAVKGLLFVPVGKHHRAGLEACQIEGLGAGDAGNHIGGDFRRQGCGGNVLLPVENQVGVDFVADYQDAVFQA